MLKCYLHIGFATDTPNGLVAPVTGDPTARACGRFPRNRGAGGTGFTPIINAPEVAILGVTRGELKPKWDGVQFVPRLMLPLNLSWDHPVIDSAAAARFLVTLGRLLGDFRRICL